MIEVKNVTKKYGKAVAVEDISFTINDGEIVVWLPMVLKATILKIIRLVKGHLVFVFL